MVCRSGFENYLDATVMLVAEGLVHLRPLLEADAVGDDEARVDLAFLDALEQVVGPAVDVGLAHAEGQALVHRRAERNLVDQPAIHAGNGNDPGRAADIDHLAQHVRAVRLQHQRLLGAVVHGVDGARRMCLHAHRVDAFFRALAPGQLGQAFEHAFLVEIDGDGAAGAGHGQPLGHVVDAHHLPGAHHHRAADGELAHRPRAPDRHRVGGLDVTLRRGLPAGRQDVAEEQHLLVGHAIGNHHRADVGVGHAHVLGLTARVAAGEVGVAVEPGSGVAEQFVGDVLVAVAALAHREVAAPTLVALATDDGEGHHHAVADFELLVRRADLHDLAHELVAHDVAVFHAGHEAVVEVQVRAADRAGTDLDDGVARIFDGRVGYVVVAADIVLAVPAKRSHGESPGRVSGNAAWCAPSASLLLCRSALLSDF